MLEATRVTIKASKVELFIEQSMGCREREPKRTKYTHGNGNVEKLIFKIESPWGLEQAKALAQGRATELFTSPLLLLRVREEE